MRRFVIAAVVLASFGLSGAAATKAASGTPEVDKANATISVKSRIPFRPVSCVGEDGVTYVTFRGSWAGTQGDVTGFTDYSLSGTLTVTGVVWTINLGPGPSTGRGVLTGTITLLSSTGAPSYSGKLTLITEGVPAAGAVIPGRGWIQAAFKLPDEAAPPPGDDNLLANTEWLIGGAGPPFPATATFGDAAGFAGIPNFSVVTNVAPVALDGTC